MCDHDDRDSIDAALVGGTPYRDVAGQFSLSTSALSRHRERHVSEALRAVVVERERERGGALLDRIEALVGRAEKVLDEAESAGKPAMALAAIRELRSLVELLGRASGELKPDGLVQVVNLVSSTEWLSIRGRLLGALAPHPDARAAVTEALAEVELTR
ncbi:MAG TPA: hypothetical protein VM262_14335 [Acidimicrobiales bacterium]|nr:hypothetical protein [Acidimicrobiales bacterium]